MTAATTVTEAALVAVGGERGVAVAVAAKVGAGDPVTRCPQGRSEETVASPQVTHARHKHHQGAGACDVVADPPLSTAEITGFLDSRHGAGMAGARCMVRCGAHAFIAFGFGLASLPVVLVWLRCQAAVVAMTAASTGPARPWRARPCSGVRR